MAEAWTINEVMKQGWELTKPNLKKLWAWYGLITVIYIGFGLMSQTGGMLGSLVSLANMVVNLMLSLGFTRVILKIVDGKAVAVGDLFWFEAKAIWTCLAASILYGLIVLGGLFLLIIPGIIWAIMFSLYQYVIVDRGAGIRESLSLSREFTRGSKGRLLVLGLVIALVNLGAALLLVIPLIFSIPWSTMTGVYVYRRLAPKAG